MQESRTEHHAMFWIPSFEGMTEAFVLGSLSHSCEREKSETSPHTEPRFLAFDHELP
jgi:hypothetical protein